MHIYRVYKDEENKIEIKLFREYVDALAYVYAYNKIVELPKQSAEEVEKSIKLDVIHNTIIALRAEMLLIEAVEVL